MYYLFESEYISIDQLMLLKLFNLRFIFPISVCEQFGESLKIVKEEISFQIYFSSIDAPWYGEGGGG